MTSLTNRFDLLTEATRNMHRAIVSLAEELEAIDWYQQRVDACSDAPLNGPSLSGGETLGIGSTKRGAAVYLKPKRGKK